MATLAEVRTRLRRRLEDTSASPLWTDAELDEALKAALEAYTARSPREATASLTASGGETELPVPSDALEVVRVVAPSGAVLPRRVGPLRGVWDEELAWEAFAGKLEFSGKLPAGTYEVWYYGERAWPAADTGSFPVDDADVPYIVAWAAVWALELRLTAEWKRSALPARAGVVLEEARRTLRAEERARFRRVRTRQVEATG